MNREGEKWRIVCFPRPPLFFMTAIRSSKKEDPHSIPQNEETDPPLGQKTGLSPSCAPSQSRARTAGRTPNIPRNPSPSISFGLAGFSLKIRLIFGLTFPPNQIFRRPNDDRNFSVSGPPEKTPFEKTLSWRSVVEQRSTNPFFCARQGLPKTQQKVHTNHRQMQAYGTASPVPASVFGVGWRHFLFRANALRSRPLFC